MSEQNEVAERMNWTLMETLRAMLSDFLFSKDILGFINSCEAFTCFGCSAMFPQEQNGLYM